MVTRLYVEKKPGFDLEARSLYDELRSFLQIDALTRLRLLNRYDVEGVEPTVLELCRMTVFAEPQMDTLSEMPPADAETPCAIFAVEALPGQFDQRADSAAQCVQLAAQCDRPEVRTARVYMLFGALGDEDIARVKRHVINPVESREASMDVPDTLAMPFVPPADVPVLDGFTKLTDSGLTALRESYALAMDENDVRFCQSYFRDEGRDPTLTELRMLDTYWSDHCRHTTFLTELSDVRFEHPLAQKAFMRYLDERRTLGREKPVTLMDVATIGAKILVRDGALRDLDESEEINACTIKLAVQVDGRDEDWLLLFKNETHNHPTEIEPYGGAATCIGGAIRDPLSGRAYVYQAMRVTGAADPLQPITKTLPGKLPQRKLVTTAAAGNSAYGNQIGLATGLVDEIYHDGYLAKHMEIGAVLGATPASNVRRETPAPGDRIVLLGGRTGRDGCGGATGSSKSHTLRSLAQCGAEVQKGNAPEERKLQRLLRNPEAARLIKRCNDFGAGGVSVAIGELADGLLIDLDAVPKKYEGLDGTELAISESQERMAVALAPQDVARFRQLAKEENLESAIVATVTEAKRLVMRWRGETVVDVSRAFLSSNGAPKKATAFVAAPETIAAPFSGEGALESLCGDLNFCSKRGLCERFDSTIGAGSVLMPLGGVRQLTPAQAMVAKLPVLHGETSCCSAMAYGFNPFVCERDPYRGGYLAVVEALARLVATGVDYRCAHLTNQEYFERMTEDPTRWGKPFSALLGALQAQLDMRVAAIGGKDSMSGSFESLNVPPTLVCFAVGVLDAKQVASPELKRADTTLALVSPVYEDDLPTAQSLRDTFDLVGRLLENGDALAAHAVGYGGIMASLLKMALGNRIGFTLNTDLDQYAYRYGAFVVELQPGAQAGTIIGQTQADYVYTQNGRRIELVELEAISARKLERVYPTRVPTPERHVTPYICSNRCERRPTLLTARPRVLIPVFPGTNCEYDTARAFERAGAIPQTVVVNNLSSQDVAESVERFAKALSESQILFLPGGFSGGDEPDGSAKFITAFLRNPRVAEEVARLLDVRIGLIGGICNGFQALIKLGLIPYGQMRAPDENAPTLTFNRIGRHQSRLIRTRVASTLSPWLSSCQVDDVHLLPVSHGEGRFIIHDDLLATLAQHGQIATQYVNLDGNPTMDIDFNPNGSVASVEGVTSPDGRVFGRMAHAERCGAELYRNVPGNQQSGMFENAVYYFR